MSTLASYSFFRTRPRPTLSQVLDAAKAQDTIVFDAREYWPQFYAAQAEWFWWGLDRDAELTIEFIGGSWRSGKTTPFCCKFITLCGLNGWNPDYEGDRPRSLLVAPTHKVLRDATLPILLKLAGGVGGPLILKHNRTEGEIHWVNGQLTLLRSAEGEIDGFEATHVGCDEIHRQTYWTDPSKITNYKARASDARAIRRTFMAVGLPTSGRVRDTFEHCDNVKLVAAADNPNNTRAFIDGLKAGAPAGMEDTFERGRWMSPPGAVFSQYDAGRHLVDWGPNPGAPVHVGMDLGNHARVVFAQQRPGGVLHVVDEMITHLVGAKDTIAAIKASRWWPMIRPGASVVCIDPTVKRDDWFTIVDGFAGCEVKQFGRNEPGYSVEWGIQQIQVALLNGLHQTRLYFERSLAKNRNGVIDALESCHRHEILGHIVKDDRTDHSRDALRYLVCRLIPDQMPTAGLLR